MFDIKGKVCLITGGVSGIGLAIAHELLQNGLMGIVLVDINEDMGQKILAEMKNKYGDSKIRFIKADVRDKDKLEESFKFAIKTFSQLDIVINGAGILKDKTIEHTIDINYVSRFLDVGHLIYQSANTTFKGLRTLRMTNTLAPICAFAKLFVDVHSFEAFKTCVGLWSFALDHYLPQYKSGNEAIILNIASTAGLEGFQSSPVYCSTKWAVVGLTRSLGTQEHYQRTKVKVIALCPGFTDTALLNVDENTFLSPVYEEIYYAIVKPLSFQSRSNVAKASAIVIAKGNNGSAWIVRNDQPPYEFLGFKS